MVRAIGVMLVLALGGCPKDGPDTVADAGPDGGSDAPGPSGGLSFEFVTDPTVSGDVGGGVRIDEVRVFLRNVRAIGDSAPGDSRTSRASLELEWHEGSFPPPLAFPLAPPGLYSRLEATLGGEEQHYDLRGTATLADSSVHPFEVSGEESRAAVSITLTGLMVNDDVVVATISLDLSFLAAVDWDAVWQERGELKIGGEEDPRSAAITAALANAFTFIGSR
jgi:hypothetical protein